VAEYLERYGSHRRQWQHVEPTEEQPEAEWGFAEPLRDDIADFATENGYRVRRLRFVEPEDLSPFVADLYAWWYRQRGIDDRRLLGSMFIQMDPWWTLRTASVPWWAKFGTHPSADKLERYLDGADPFDEIFLMLFSHGVEGVGQAPIERWRRILGRARSHGDFVGVDEAEFPRDFATLKRYHDDLPEKIDARHSLPGPLPLADLDRFIEEHRGRHAVALQDLEIAATPA
jgi:hypothetical protein